MKTVHNTILFGVPLSVTFSYEPEEKQSWSDPGCSDSLEIHGIKTVGGCDIVEIMDQKYIETIEKEILDLIHTHQRKRRKVS